MWTYVSFFFFFFFCQCMQVGMNGQEKMTVSQIHSAGESCSREVMILIGSTLETKAFAFSFTLVVKYQS